jgi:serine phosphatase RsbU (regulator of sigma subunit)
VGLVVGDATGHGIEAATYAAEMKFALRLFLRDSASPADALRRLNDFLLEKDRLDPLPSGGGGSYVAMSVSVVDTREGGVCCAWAGIEPPFLVRADTGEAVELSGGGGRPLLGIDSSSEYGEERAALALGDVLAMSTDGLTEAHPRARRWPAGRGLLGEFLRLRRAGASGAR